MLNTFLAACELKRKVWPALLFAVMLAFSTAVPAQEHSPSSPSQPAAASADQGQPAASAQQVPAAAEHAQPAGEHAAEGGHDQSIGGMILGMGWPVANFIIFVGVIYYFGNGPLKDYLATRSSSIRKDLVEAAELKASATAQLAAIDQKLQALPGVLDALRVRGAEEIAAEEKRIAAAADADRERLLEQTRREIDLQVRLAKKDLLEHAADLSVQLAAERLKKDITPADQSRLVDQYLTQVKDQR